MADKNIQMAQRNATNNGWDNLYPQTKAKNIILDNGTPDYVRIQGYAVDSGSQNHLVVTLSPVPTAYTDGMCLNVKTACDNTGAADINVNSLGTKTIKNGTDDLSAGDITAGQIISIIYNATTGNFTLRAKGGGNPLLKMSGTVSSDGSIALGDAVEIKSDATLRKAVGRAIAGSGTYTKQPGTPTTGYNETNVQITDDLFIRIWTDSNLKGALGNTQNAADPVYSTTQVISSTAYSYLKAVMLDGNRFLIIGNTGNVIHAFLCTVDISTGTINLVTDFTVYTESDGPRANGLIKISNTKVVAVWGTAAASDKARMVVINISGSTVTMGTIALMDLALMTSASWGPYIDGLLLDAVNRRFLVIADVYYTSSHAGASAFYIDDSDNIVRIGSSYVSLNGTSYGQNGAPLIQRLSDTRAIVISYSYYGYFIDITTSTITATACSDVHPSGATGVVFSMAIQLYDKHYLMLGWANPATTIYAWYFDDDGDETFTIETASLISFSTVSVVGGSCDLLKLFTNKILAIVQGGSSTYYAYTFTIDTNGVTPSLAITQPPLLHGIAIATVASGGTLSIILQGVLSGLSGLTPGTDYYYALDGSLTNTQTAVFAGHAISTTEMVVFKTLTASFKKCAISDTANVKRTYSGTVTTGKAIKLNSDGTISDYAGTGRVIGIAQGSGVVALKGLSSVHTGLVPGEEYYVQSDGTLETLVTDIYAGYAISSTKLVMPRFILMY